MLPKLVTLYSAVWRGKLPDIGSCQYWDTEVFKTGSGEGELQKVKYSGSRGFLFPIPTAWEVHALDICQEMCSVFWKCDTLNDWQTHDWKPTLHSTYQTGTLQSPFYTFVKRWNHISDLTVYEFWSPTNWIYIEALLWVGDWPVSTHLPISELGELYQICGDRTESRERWTLSPVPGLA